MGMGLEVVDGEASSLEFRELERKEMCVEGPVALRLWGWGRCVVEWRAWVRREGWFGILGVEWWGLDVFGLDACGDGVFWSSLLDF